jgi:hypothetical protein
MNEDKLNELEKRFEECKLSLTEYDILKEKLIKKYDLAEPAKPPRIEKKKPRKLVIALAVLVLLAGLFFVIKVPSFTGLFVQNISNETDITENASIVADITENLTSNISAENIGKENKTKKISSNKVLDELNDKFNNINFEKDKNYLKIKHKKAEIRLKGANETEINEVQVVSEKEINIQRKKASFGTPIIAINSINITNATIVIDKEGAVNKIVYCPDWDFEAEECSVWIETNIPFEDLGDKIRFTVTHFTAYAGSYVTDIASEWDRGLFTNTEKLGNVTILAGANTTGTYTSYFFRNGTTANDIRTVDWTKLAWVDDYNSTTKYQEHPVRSSMVSYWKLNNNADDETANNNDGSVNGATPTTTCKLGTGNCAYDFDGVDDYVTIPADSSLDLATQSIEMWVKPAINYSDGDCEISLIGRFNSTYAEGWKALYLGFLGDEESACEFGLITATDDTDYWLLVNNSLNAGNWYHVVGTFDNSANEMKLYVNGALEGSAEYHAPNNGDIDYAVGALQANDTVGDFFNGTIDNVIIYNKALTATEVNESYARGAKELNITLAYRTTNETQEVYNTSGLMGWWKLDENATDFSGNGNDGTINGAVKTGGYFNNSYDFDGTTSDYVEVPSVTLGIPFSMEAWINADTLPASTSIISISDGYWKRMGLESAGTGNLWMWFMTSSGNYVGWYTAYPPTGQWVYVAGVISGTGSGDGHIYYNGIEQPVTFDSGGTVGASNTAPLFIGMLDAYGDYPYDGKIDSARIYNRTLTAEEIKYNYWHANLTGRSFGAYKAESPQSFSTTAKYFQYKAKLQTNESGYTPFLEKTQANFSFTTANTPPTQGTPTLNSSKRLNRSNENLTVYNVSTYDADGDNVTNIINWYRNGTSIMVLNMPFNSNNSAGAGKTKDYSGFGNNGTVNGATWTSAGYKGGAYSFDGSSNYINLGTSNSLNIKNTITIESWVYLPDLTGGHTIVSKQGCDEYRYNYGLVIMEADIGFWLDSNTKQGEHCTIEGELATTNNPITTTGWHHIAGTYDGNYEAIYLDGVEVKNQTVSIQGGLAQGSWDTYIGKSEYASQPVTDFFNGNIDSVRIYNRSLSAAQIKAIYENKTNFISSEEIKKGEIWQAAVTPNDGYEDGLTKFSNNITILSTPPTQGTPTLNSSRGLNRSDENLTVYNISTYDRDGDPVTNIINWYRNGTSITVLNMPFESNNSAGAGKTKDYSPYGNNGTVNGATWISNGGFDGKGAYDFDGNDEINVGSSTLPISDKNFTVELWVRFDAHGHYAMIGKNFDYAGEDWTIFKYGSGYDFLYFNAGNTGVITPAFVPVLGEWYHLAMTGNGLTFTAYLNGEVIGTPAAYTANGNALAPAVMGERSAGYYLDGALDSVRIYNRALTDAQIKALYQNRTDLIVAEETVYRETWNATITPNDGYWDGPTKWSNSIFITSSIPPNIANIQLHDKNQTPITNKTVVKAGENITINVTVAQIEAPVSKVWIKIWKTVASALTTIFEGFLSLISGDLWQITITTNASWHHGTNYTIYTNDTYNITGTRNENVFVNNLPTQGVPVLNSSSRLNRSNENLTVYNISTYDSDGDSVTSIINWYMNGTSIAVLNMPFNSNNSAGAGKTKDYSPYGNNGTVNGATWAINGGFDGKGAYSFDGNDYINTADTVSLEPANAITVEAWVNFSSFSYANALVKKTGAPEDGFALEGDAQGDNPCFWVTGGGSGSWGGVCSSEALTTGKWYHIVATYDSSNINVYINGINRGSTGETGAITYGNGGTYLGMDQINGRYFNGKMGSVRIYNRSLSEAQIKALYQNRTDLIVRQEIKKGEIWHAAVTPNDGYEDGLTKFSNNVTILSTPPTQGTPILNSTRGTNKSDENLTVYNISTYDYEGNNVTNIINWYRNGTSINVLNMPFESNNSAGAGKTKDYSPYGNNGTVNGATWVSNGGFDGKGAYSFDGTDNYINTSDIDLPGPFAIEAWVYPKTGGDAGQGGAIVIKHESYYFQIYNPPGDLKLGAYLYGLSNPGWFFSSSQIQLNKWQHVAVTYDGSYVKFYINGNLDGTPTATTGSVTNNAYLTIIGNMLESNPLRDWNGTIDSVRIYNRSLTAEQIKALYNNRTDLIVSQEIKRGEIWKAAVTPNNGYEDGITKFSNNVTILNSAPTQGTPKLNSSKGLNRSDENLTVHNVSTYDRDSDSVTNIINWYRNGTSIMILNMQFESDNSAGPNMTRDYSLGKNGTINGAVWSSGAYTFDGTYEDYINISDSPYDFTDSYSIETWIKVDGDSADEVIVGKNSAYALHYGLANYGVGGIANRFGFSTVDGASIVTVNALQNASIGNWTHVVGIYDDAANNLTLYVNGVFQNSTAVANDPPNTADQLCIGSIAPGSLTFGGAISSVRIYNRSLTAAQVKALYLNRTDLIVAEETVYRETWNATITPNDGYTDGNTEWSNSIFVRSSIPLNITAIQLHDKNQTPITNKTLVKAGENITINVTVEQLEAPVDSVWIKVWKTVASALTTIFEGFLSLISGDLWQITITTNASWHHGTNYTIYTNDTYELISSRNGTVFVNNLPTQGTPTLSSSLGKNTSAENLTVSSVSTYDSDGDSVTNIINWYMNGTSIMLLNMPFNSNNSAGAGKTKDYSPYWNNGTVNGATWSATSGFDGKGAYSFDGTNDYMTLGTINMNSDYTVEAWVKFNDTTADATELINLYGETYGSFGPGSGLNWYDDGYFYYRHINGGSYSDKYLNFPFTPTVGTWYFISVTYETASNGIKIYVNGNLLGSDTMGQDWASANTMLVGAFDQSGYGLQAFFNGTIDSVRIYNRSLSEAQIKALYNNRTDRIVAEETEIKDIWNACITPNDGYEDGTTKCSNNVTINTPPAVALASPANNSVLNNSYVTLNWTYSDDDNDVQQEFNIVVDNNADFSSPEVNNTEWSSNNYTQTWLTYTGTYYWKVRVHDGNEWGSFSGTQQFTLSCLTPYDSLYISTDTKLCQGTFYITDYGNGVIRFNASDITLDCNNATIIGTDQGYGVYDDGYGNVTIKNCNLKNYLHGIFVDRANLTKITNNTLTSFGAAWASVINLENSNYATIYNNRLLNSTSASSISLADAVGALIKNNYIDRSKNGVIINNNVKNTIILNNTITNQVEKGVYFSGNNFNNTISTNTIINITGSGFAGFGIDVRNNSNTIIGNTIINANTAGIVTNPNSARDTVIKNNKIYNSTGANLGTGIWLLGVNDSITNNIVSGSNYGILLGIFGVPQKTKISGNNLSNNSLGIVSYISLNLSISNNKISSASVGVYLYGSNFINITHNSFYSISNYSVFATNVSKNNSIWLNHFFSKGVKINNSGNNVGNNYCINGEGNFYDENIPASDIGPNDCGPSNLTNPAAGNYSGNITINWTRQSSFSTVNYDVFVNKTSENNNTLIANTTALNFVWNTLGYSYGNYTITIVPWISGSRHNATHAKSGEINFGNAAPSTPLLDRPANDAIITDRTPRMNWTAATDADEQPLTYQLLVDNDTSFASPEINVTISDTNYTPANDLYFGTYNWKVRAYDGEDYGSFSAQRNFTIITSITCSMPVNAVSFGEINPGATNNTEGENPAPFIVQNNGNLKLNISINSTDLWKSQPNPSSYYQFRIDKNESSSWNYALNDSWHNIVKTAPLLSIGGLKYHNESDSAEIEIQVTGPSDEGAGAKKSQLNVWCTQDE